MTGTRVVMVASLALFLVGCGGQMGELEEEGPAAAVAVAPARVEPASVETPAASTAPVESEVWDPATFLKKIPANPMGSSDDGLARSRDWKVLDWANKGEASPWKWRSSADDVALVVKLSGGRQDKTAISRPVKLALAEKGTLRMDIYNATTHQIPVAFAAFTSVDRVYFESIRQILRPGWNHTAFDLSSSNYKCASSQWKHTASIWGRDDVREIALLLYGRKAPPAGVEAPPAGQEAGALAIDSIEVDGKLTE